MQLSKFNGIVRVTARFIRTRASSYSSQLFRRSRLFKVTMIDWFLNNTMWGLRGNRAYVLTVVFLGTRVDYCNASMMLIFGGFRGHCEK